MKALSQSFLWLNIATCNSVGSEEIVKDRVL